jgi:tetratricopeptide (TPR) repeat protein
VRPSFLRAAVLSIALLSIAACSLLRFGPTRCPGEGGPPWRELRSQHFLLRTDLAPYQAERVSNELETMEATLLALAWPGAAPPPGKVLVIALASEDELQEYVEEHIGGFAHREEMEPSIVIEGSHFAQARVVLTHELAHHLSYALLLRQPRWLSEGLAGYLETASARSFPAEATMGAPNFSRLESARQFGLMPFARLATFDDMLGDANETLRFYSTSWLLVHYLVSERGPAFASYQARLARAEDPDAAWKASFADLPAEKLDAALAEYATRREYKGLGRKMPEVHLAFNESPLSDAEAHAIRARLAVISPSKMSDADRQTRARVQIAEARRLDPDNVSAAQVEASFVPPGARVDPARRAAKAHPQDWRAQYLLCEALEETDGDRVESEKACRASAELAPESSAAVTASASALLRRGNGGVALPLAVKAVRLAPWSPRALDTAAVAFSDLGRCPEARQFAQRALDVLPHGSEAAARQLRERLAEINRRCAGKP